MPKGLGVKAYTHTQQAHVAVAQGALLLGFGRKMDQAKTVAMPAAGSLWCANAPHYEGRDSDTLIIGSALGGWKTTELE